MPDILEPVDNSISMATGDTQKSGHMTWPDQYQILTLHASLIGGFQYKHN